MSKDKQGQRWRRWLVAMALAALVAAYIGLDLGRYLSLDAIQASQAELQAWREARPVLAGLIYFGAYVVVTALSLPGAAVMTLAGGAMFGLGWGTLIVSFASSIGATLAFLASRWLLGGWVQARFGDRLATLNAGIARDGGFYLFTLRLVPVLPFFVINLAMGVTTLRTWTFYWVSQIGMFAGTLVYVNAGTQLGQIQSLSGIVSPGVLGSLVLLGVFPLIARKLIDLFKARKVYARFKQPARFDRNLVVIGGGSAGLVTAYIAAAIKARVTLVEQHALGGDCLNTGCVPSKALIRSAKFLSHVRRAPEFGMRSASADFDFGEVMERVQRVVQAIEPHDSVERYTGLGVDVAQGRARIVSPWAVEITHHDGRVETLTTRAIVIAAGARPFVPPIPGLDRLGPTELLTSDNVWQLRQRPARLVVLGGGPIGSELTQAFARLGSQVTQVEMAARILGREDEDVSALVTARFRAEGITVLTGHKALRVAVEGSQKVLVVEVEGQERSIPFDALLVAVGRVANLKGYGLEELGVTTGRTVEVNGYLQTNIPNIFAAGDVAGPYQFTHVAAHQAWYAAVNALFDPFKKFSADYRVIPWATFVEPEVARVGLNELEAKEKGIPHEVTVYGIDDLDRAIADSEAHGFVKVLTVPGKDKILGVTLVGEHAADLLAEYVLAMKHGIGLNKILGTIHTYPTLAEANKYAAGTWKRAHAPQALLAWVARFHAWRRG
ncbi:FAD-dependent oxidoreductase [Sphaerotilus mobilis]|uniref:Pyruvate/2-oxoglutarate dehydrogenase complex dihydrolipoamide dehydrogenase (E3) component n=1 Tax=Sphaerotilus mobilis TaxID=47994 RepID=A0A4Q7LD76_9BURK|nr:bifunctional TVP38/TMEM64 family protein/FAD-dependent oxidoreductase [Sphaerotilus mobilis]RZS52346.1 pyruvate/2-oxoglutarate dehydrogenase complex dihydrolipoamide dehydrogenase (E3) component [Sphaerotilus mobilis]